MPDCKSFDLPDKENAGDCCCYIYEHHCAATAQGCTRGFGKSGSCQATDPSQVRVLVRVGLKNFCLTTEENNILIGDTDPAKAKTQDQGTAAVLAAHSLGG